jgi:hypothetical protein
MSEDEYDNLPDPFAGVDWNVVPGLSNVPLTSHFRDGTPCDDRVTAELPVRHSTPTPANRENSAPPPSQYLFEEVDATFLAEIDEVERRLLQPRVTGPGVTLTPATIGDRNEEVSTHFDTGTELTSRYFHSKCNL